MEEKFARNAKKPANSVVSVQRTAAFCTASAYRTAGSRYNPCGSAGGRANGDL